jgi:hypothetical protein
MPEAYHVHAQQQAAAPEPPSAPPPADLSPPAQPLQSADGAAKCEPPSPARRFPPGFRLPPVATLVTPLSNLEFMFHVTPGSALQGRAVCMDPRRLPGGLGLRVDTWEGELSDAKSE